MNIGILQDSREDWEEAAATMAGIYENAHITIAATASKDSNGGLFSSIRPAMRRLNQHLHLYVQVPLIAFPVGVYYERPESLPLLSRAWVYQERRLSPRTIHFGKDQVYWECQTQFASEDAGEDRIWLTHDADFGDVVLEVDWGDKFVDCTSHWQKMVTEYTGLRLTFESDRLPAIAALADRMSQLREKDDVYISGIWKKSILSDLLWYTSNNNPRPVRNVPSWSWASTQGSEIEWGSDKFPEQTEVVSVKSTAIGAANLGEVTNASIILRAHVLSLSRVDELVPADNNDLGHIWRFWNIFKSAPAMKPFKENNLKVVHSNFWSDYDVATANPPYIPGRIMKLLVTKATDTGVGAIVVQQIPNDAAEYERIGFLHIGVSLTMHETPEEGGGEWQRDDDDWQEIEHQEWAMGAGGWHDINVETEERIDSLILSLPMEEVKIV
jgi:hypothetical protein